MEKRYAAMNEHICPTPGLNRAVLERTEPRRRRSLRPAVALTLVLVMLLSAPRVLANPDIYRLLHDLSPETAARFAPVQERCEANGICMEVVAASVHGKSAEIYLEMEDLSADRLTVQSYPEIIEIFGLSNYGSGVKPVGFEEETGCVTLLLDYEVIRGDFEDQFRSGRLTLYLDDITTYTGSEAYMLPLTLTENETMSLAFRQVNPDGSLTEGGGDGYDLTGWSGQYHNSPSVDVLRPLADGAAIAQGICVTAAAYVDGELHIQTLTSCAEPAFDICITDEAGNVIHPEKSVTFTPGGTDEYTEYVFPTAPRTPEGMTLMVQISNYTSVQGPWRITFDLDSVRSSYHDPDDDIEKITEPVA